MKISFFILLTFFLTIIQTAAFPDFFLSNHFFDLLIIIILYLGLTFKHPAIIFVVVLIGSVVDSLSGVYFGLYLTTYIWIYIIVQGLKLFVFSRNTVFYLVISITAVSIESLFLIISVFISQGKSGVASLNYYLMLKQMFLACIFIPLSLVIITFIQKKYEIFIENLSSKINRNSDYSN